MAHLLDVAELRVAYGAVVAVDGVSLHVDTGEVVGLIGPNGAGKSTFIDALTGYLPGRGGRVTFEGESLDGRPAHVVARRGLVRTFQSVELFDDLTVEENLLVAAERPTLWHAMRDLLVPSRPQGVDDVAWARGLCDLDDVAHRYPQELSHGQRKLVGVARALSQRPRLVLMDEPAAGLDTEESLAFGRRLRSLPEHGVSVLLVDHDMGLVLGVCDRIVVIDFGRVIAQGTPAQIRADAKVIEAYLEVTMPGSEPSNTTPFIPATKPPEPLLEVRGLDAGYNGFPVVRDIDLTVRAGEVVALLGSNGAGKTTTLSAIAGLITPMGGTISFAGQKLNGIAAHRVARRGLALVPENRALFNDLTTRENLRLARVRGRSNEDEILDLLPELRKCLGRKAGLLSGGEQQMLAVGRALVARPSLLVVDEMSLGLAPVVVERLVPVLRTVAESFGSGVLVVEQHVAVALDVAERAYVLAHGRIVLEGRTADLRSRRELLMACYLGDLEAAGRMNAEVAADLASETTAATAMTTS